MVMETATLVILRNYEVFFSIRVLSMGKVIIFFVNEASTQNLFCDARFCFKLVISIAEELFYREKEFCRCFDE